MSEVKLASFTRAVEGQSVNENLVDLVAYYARVSNPTSQISGINNEKLIRYLIRNKHWSPFEMANVCLDILSSRDITRQLIRHKSFSLQEFSQRYAATETVYGFREARVQDLTNRQNSLPNTDVATEAWWKRAQTDVENLTFSLYDQALKMNIAKEQARALLPEGLTRTRLYVNGNLRSWIHYVELRTDPSTQKEHRVLATQCATEIAKVFPMIMEFVHEQEREEY